MTVVATTSEHLLQYE